MIYLEILGTLLAILFSCLVFANAIENLGKNLKLGNEVTGSILAAVGTALPETIVPLTAIFLITKSGNASSMHDIAIGSIIGAPFLLGTLAFFLLGLTILIFKKSRGSIFLEVNKKHVQRDLYYFLICFSLAILASFTEPESLYRIGIAVMISLTYGIYIFATLRASDGQSGHGDSSVPSLYLSRMNIPSNIFVISVQVIIGLGAIIYFANIFVRLLEHASSLWSMNPLILSLIITPIATELPEKVNSVIWSSQGKDALAMGNLTGAMVFQASIPCTIGVLFTPWKLDFMASLCIILTIIGALIVLISLYKPHKKITAYTLLLSGSLYLVYILAIFYKAF
jgi:cation:H+ antiporter